MDSAFKPTPLPNCPNCVAVGKRCARCWGATTKSFFWDGFRWTDLERDYEIVLVRHDDEPFLRNGNYYFLWEGDLEGGWRSDMGVKRLRVMEFYDKRIGIPENPDSDLEYWDFELLDGRMPQADLERLVWEAGEAELTNLAERQNRVLQQAWEKDIDQFPERTPFRAATLADYCPELRRWFENEPSDNAP